MYTLFYFSTGRGKLNKVAFYEIKGGVSVLELWHKVFNHKDPNYLK